MNMHEECLKRQNEGYHTPLPEVIKRIERDRQKITPRYAVLDIQDALFYLREYCEKRDEICEIAKIMADSWELRKQTMAFEDRNEPLSWDELQQMEGKPVWIEENYFDGEEWHGRWNIVHHINKCTLYTIGSDGYYAKTLGMTWQAYRKERHD